MKKIYVIAVVMLSVMFTSCKKETLQTYLVAVKEQPNFVTLDFSTSMLPLKMSEKASAEDKKALESVRKINVAFLQKNKAMDVEIEAEKQKLKSILKKSDYKKLMKFNHKGASGTIYYSGETDAIDELIAFGYSDDYGVGVIRLLGDNMNPNALKNMMKSVEPDDDNGKMKKLKGVFESIATQKQE